MQQDMKVDYSDPISTNRRGEKREREGNERTKKQRRGLTLSASAAKSSPLPDEVATWTSGQVSWDYLSRIVVSILDRLSVYKRGFPDPSVNNNSKLDLGPALSATGKHLTAEEASDDSCDSPTPPCTPLPHYFLNPPRPVLLHDDKVLMSAPETRWSSGVPFQPQGRYWRIGGEWYDFTTFAEIHPGGAQILFLARDRFNDATYAFEAHHMNYGRARAIIQKYKLPPTEQKKLTESYNVPAPKLLPDGSFYSEVRRRVSAHFKSRRINYRTPTPECFAFFWIVFICWCLAVVHALVLNPTVFAAICQGLLGALLGAFGHNFVHQPKYKWIAYLCLDTIGFSSDGWYREHVLQHHMYTNTPLDNHFKGTEPFLVTDPTVPRTWLQSNVTPYINTLLLSFGVWANYITHSIEVYKGNEKFVVMKIFFPALLLTFIALHGLWGLVLFHIQVSTLSMWYFTMALMNHNSETSQNVALRNSMKDWGSAQIVSCTDWAIKTEFVNSWPFLWLNYHSVHHLFPLIDFSHHRDVQVIIMETCRDHGLTYEAGDFFELYRQMIHSFSTPSSLLMTINAYNGS